MSNHAMLAAIPSHATAPDRPTMTGSPALTVMRSVIAVLVLSLSLVTGITPSAHAAKKPTPRKATVTLAIGAVRVNPGKAIAVKATVRGMGRKTVVRLQEYRKGRWVTVKKLRKTSASTFRSTWRRTAAGLYRLRTVASAPTQAKRTSKVRSVRVRRVSRVTVQQSAVTTAGRSVTLSGRILPALPTVPVQLQRLAGSKWVKVDDVEPDASGRFDFSVWPGASTRKYRVIRKVLPGSSSVASAARTVGGTRPSVCTQPVAINPSQSAVLTDLLGQAALRPVVMVAAGSSTTYGSGATSEQNRWLNRFAATLQNDQQMPGMPDVTAHLPRQPEEGWSQPPWLPGLHFVNAAASGTTSANYLFDSAQARLSGVINLSPDVVIHMVGSNDYYYGRDPFLYYAWDVRATIEAIDAGVPDKDVLHILVHSYGRLGPELPWLTWSSYGSARAQVTAEDPAHRVFVDLSDWFDRAGIADTDPWGLIRDNVHPTDVGHAAIDGLMRQSLGLNKDC